MILIGDVLRLHDASINDFGGSKGVRDLGLLESAIARPFQTFEVNIYTLRLSKWLPLWVKV